MTTEDESEAFAEELRAGAEAFADAMAEGSRHVSAYRALCAKGYAAEAGDELAMRDELEAADKAVTKMRAILDANPLLATAIIAAGGADPEAQFAQVRAYVDDLIVKWKQAIASWLSMVKPAGSA